MIDALEHGFTTRLKFGFLPEPELETGTTPDVLARNVLRILLMGNEEDWSQMITMETLSAVFLKPNVTITNALRLEFQRALYYFYNMNLSDNNLDAWGRAQAKQCISNSLTYMALMDWNSLESLDIPQYINGQWQMVPCKISRIDLTPRRGIQGMAATADDELFALGLQPVCNPNAYSVVSFPCTLYPACRGFFTTIEADLLPFSTPGTQLLANGNTALRRWLERQQSSDIHACGISLGGALAYMAATEFSEYFTSFNALNPPGVYNALGKSQVFHNWDNAKRTGRRMPIGTVLRQDDDPISLFGSFHPDWNLCQVARAPGHASNPLRDHLMNFAGLENCEFIPLDVAEDNEKRKIRKLLWYSIIRALFYYLVYVPFRYVVLPPVRYIKNNLLQLIIAAPLMVICATLTFPASMPLFVGIASGFIASHLNVGVENGPQYPLLRKCIAVAGIVILVSATVLLSIFVSMISAFMVPAVLIAYMAIVKLAEHAFSRQQRENYQELRNDGLVVDELDMYRQDIDAEFTLKEIRDYYTIRRCVLKGREDFRQSNSGLSKGSFFMHGARCSKQEVLEQSSDIRNLDQVVVRRASRAKIFEMQETLRLNRLHLDGARQYHANYEDYRRGKLKVNSPEAISSLALSV